ncbi:hypothetical protein SDRG_12964 [Saprolegnia diclina VS20]|uniref:Uncharacterized protein n=1 Tax=Saprolegnia diclina (strain VS20) TaxID=1156394 RepID=T0Q743_SAPDV|nr:hypothetical protein SDRG_12964 [Saprolegnia diclina VS20]EQC29295.1 hypothetical protein SDRG_12964 [Saprolegnia diclina VS20]|eukprot:XP_008617269.1 hypothetical protein SDRG_12964 [Saprolegnia diclina VS20]
MRLVLFTCCGLGMTMATTKTGVYLPGSWSPEYTPSTIKGLPTCSTNNWVVSGSTYDGVTACSNAKSTKISINPFRCTQYNAIKNIQGIYDCSSCFYGWRFAPNGDVLSYESTTQAAGIRLSAYFVPQTIKSLDGMKSCLMTNDANLASLCDFIERDSLAPGAKATCVKKSSPPYTFAKPLNDAASCNTYAVKNRQVVCTK